MKLKNSLYALILAGAMIINTACQAGSELSVTEEQTTVGQTTTEQTTTTEESVTITTEAEPETPDETDSEPTETETTGGESTAATTTATTAATTAKPAATTTKPAATTTKPAATTTKPAATTTKPAATTTAATTAATTSAPTPSGSSVSIKEMNLPSSVATLIDDMGAGWNLGNAMDGYNASGASETAWVSVKTTKKLIDAVKAAGFNTVRIPVSYRGKVKDGTYKIDEEWLSRVNEIVDYVIDNGMYAIINIHHDGNNDGEGAWLDCSAADQTEIRKKFTAMWEQISAHFKDYGSKLIFESMNEIMEEGNYSTNVPSTFYTNINTLNQLFVDAVRKSGGNNTSRLLLVPGYNTNIDATILKDFVLPTDSASGKLIVSVHYYDPYDFALNESSKIHKWGADYLPSGWGNEDYVLGQMKKLYDTFTSKGIPVVIGEYGCIDKRWANDEANIYRRYYLEYVAKAAVSYGCVPVYWDNGYDGKNGFALFDRKNATVLYPELVCAIVNGADRSTHTVQLPK